MIPPIIPTRPVGQSWIHRVRDTDTDNPVPEYAELPADEQDFIPGKDAVGDRDPSRDGRVTCAVPMTGSPHRVTGEGNEGESDAGLLLARNKPLIIARELPGR